MSKVLKRDELCRNNRVQFSEQYVVKFWVQTGEFWEQRSEDYYTTGKGDHDAVERRWKNEYKNINVDLISVTYQ